MKIKLQLEPVKIKLQLEPVKIKLQLEPVKIKLQLELVKKLSPNSNPNSYAHRTTPPSYRAN